MSVRYAQNAIDGGAITAEDGARWVARLTELAEAGSYLSGITYYVSVGVRSARCSSRPAIRGEQRLVLYAVGKLK